MNTNYEPPVLEDDDDITDPDHPDFEPTDDQMMSAFGTKWHDGL